MTYIAITADASRIRKVRKRLRRKGYEAYVPCIVTKRAIAKGGKLSRKRRIVPLMSYVLVEMPDQAVFDLWLHDVLAVKDVRGIVSNGDDAAVIPDRCVGDLREAVAKMVSDEKAARAKRWLSKGRKAVIKSGSLAGRHGTVAWIKGKKAGLEAILFGSTRVLEVEKSNLEAA